MIRFIGESFVSRPDAGQPALATRIATAFPGAGGAGVIVTTPGIHASQRLEFKTQESEP